MASFGAGSEVVCPFAADATESTVVKRVSIPMRLRRLACCRKSIAGGIRGQYLTAWHPFIERIIAQAARLLAHNRNDLPYDVAAIGTGGFSEQVAHGRPDLGSASCLFLK